MLNPILSFSATRRMRTFRMMLILLIYVLLLLGIAVWLMAPFFAGRVTLGFMTRGVTCYTVLLILQFALIVLIAPAMSSGAIAGERDRRTLELLLVTQTGSFRIVLGKALESFAFLALLILCGLPVMCLCLITGGITFTQVLLGELYLMAIAFAAVSLGVFCSTIARSTVVAAVLSYLAVMAIGAVTVLPVLTGYPQRITDKVYDPQLYAAMTPGQAFGLIHPALFLNPGYGLTALLQGQTQGLTSMIEDRGWGRLLATWLLMKKLGCTCTALICAAVQTAVSFALLGIAALLVRPSERRRRANG